MRAKANDRVLLGLLFQIQFVGSKWAEVGKVTLELDLPSGCHDFPYPEKENSFFSRFSGQRHYYTLEYFPEQCFQSGAMVKFQGDFD